MMMEKNEQDIKGADRDTDAAARVASMNSTPDYPVAPQEEQRGNPSEKGAKTAGEEVNEQPAGTEETLGIP